VSKSGNKKQQPCLLLFSGGRDSTLSAVKLADQYNVVNLLTITADHLHGIDMVKDRLSELSGKIKNMGTWYLYEQQPNVLTNYDLFAPTCLPCHSDYISIAVRLCIAKKISILSLGYVKYQSHWPEQTPLAVKILREIISYYGISLELPVYDYDCKDDAILELDRLGLSPVAMEQKCERQTSNIELKDDLLENELVKWRQVIMNNLTKKSMQKMAFKEVLTW